MRLKLILGFLIISLSISFTMCEEGGGQCTNNAPTDHTISVSDEGGAGCLHKTGYRSPNASGCFVSGCHSGSGATASASAPSCFKCHGQKWVD